MQPKQVFLTQYMATQEIIQFLMVVSTQKHYVLQAAADYLNLSYTIDPNATDPTIEKRRMVQNFLSQLEEEELLPQFSSFLVKNMNFSPESIPRSLSSLLTEGQNNNNMFSLLCLMEL